MEKEMTKRKWILLLTVYAVMMSTMAFGAGLGCTETREQEPGFEFVSYAGTGGGAGLVLGEWVPRMDFASGFQLKPWLGLGAFLSAFPLSDFTDADLGVSVADRPNAGGYTSGGEILLTPWANNLVHPLIRVSLGGVSVGYGEDLDGDTRTLEQAVGERYFYASAAGGVEFSITRHLRLAGTAGWQFGGNDLFMGIGKNELSGFTAGISARIVWNTVIR